MNSEELKFKKYLKKIKENKDIYFTLVTSGHCAVCLSKLEMTQDMINIFTTSTCSECKVNGLDAIFQKGLICGLELIKWKKEHSLGNEKNDKSP